jgi:hypothetical protein
MLTFYIQAQTPYKGGVGDGYAVASLELEALSSVVQGRAAGVYPTVLRNGENIHLPDGLNLKQLYLVTVKGEWVQLDIPGTGNTGIPVNVEVPGLYILRMVAGDDKQYFSKLILLGN